MPDPAPFRADLAEAPDGTRAAWVAAGRMRLRVAVTPPGPRGTALILPGRTEYAEKYGRVMRRLAALGLGSVVIDWRGQGLSTRPLGKTALGHVGSFGEYQADLAAVLALPAVAAMPGPRVMFAHSMGGCIGLRALLSPLDVRAAVFSAPMWDINLSPPLRLFARVLSGLACAGGVDLLHAPGGDAVSYVVKQGFEGNVLTSDPEHFAWLKAHLAAEPGLALGGPSFGWIRAGLAETSALATLPPPPVPALVLLGSEEAVVSPGAVRGQAARMPGARLSVVPGARHEIWMERAEVQAHVWAATAAFLDRVLG